MQPKRFCYILAAVIGCALVTGAGAYYYATRTVSTETTELKQRLASIEQADEKLSQLAKLRKQYSKVEPFLPSLETALPRHKRQSEITLQLHQLASSNGLTLGNTGFAASGGLPSPTTQTTKEGDVLSLPINFQMAGSFDQMQGFLRGLEQLNRYVSVSNLSINRIENRPRQVNFSITLNAYVKP